MSTIVSEALLEIGSTPMALAKILLGRRLSETGNEISDGIVCIALRQTYSKVSVTFGTHPLILASIFSKPRPQHLSSAIYPSTQSQRKGFHPSNAPYKHRSP